MNWMEGMQRSIDYIEEHITEKIDYEALAKYSCMSSYNFQRVFGILSGYTLGEYIRNRKLSLAGRDIAQTDMKVIDVAIKYGYESPDSFAKAFQKFHGVTPSIAREAGATLCSFAKVTVTISLEGGTIMNYRIEDKPEMVLTGYKRRFAGVPYGEERLEQEHQMYASTRAKQWLLIGASSNYAVQYNIVTNVSDEGYDFYIAHELDLHTRKDMQNPSITGVDFMPDMGFESILIPRQTYAVFETEKTRNPIGQYMDLRKGIVSEWLPNSGYEIADAPELALLHWRLTDDRNKRYAEIWLPIEQAIKNG